MSKSSNKSNKLGNQQQSDSQQKPANYIGFTITGKGLLPHIHIDVQVGANLPNNVENKEEDLQAFKASVDFAITHTRLSSQALRALGLRLLDKIDVYLPNRIRLAAMPIEIAALPNGVDVVLGMDFLNTGDISVSAFEGKTQFSYRTPPQGGLDFVAMQAMQTKNADKLTSKNMASHASTKALLSRNGTAMVSREQPCPCGSGKKHGNCCARIH